MARRKGMQYIPYDYEAAYASSIETYYIKEIHMVDGKKMVRTVGDLYLSGETEFVQFEQL